MMTTVPISRRVAWVWIGPERTKTTLVSFFPLGRWLLFVAGNSPGGGWYSPEKVTCFFAYFHTFRE